MQDPLSFYQSQVSLHKGQLSRIRRKLFVSSMIRLVLFLLAVFALYFFYGQTNRIIEVIALTFVLFLFLVSRHTDLQKERDKQLALIRINETEIEVLRRNFLHLPDGAEFQDPGHHFSQDIDLFGRGSFYQYCNRTGLQQGSQLLAKLLTENDIEDIVAKQDAVKELTDLPTWRQEFSAVAALVKTEIDHTAIIEWMRQYKEFIPSSIKYVPWAFTGGSAVVIVSYFLSLISGWLLAGWFFLGLFITGRFLKKINKLSSDTSRIQGTFQQYQKLLFQLEEATFESKVLRNKREGIVEGGEKASDVMNRFSRLLNALDQRNNLIIGLLTNAFMLRDIQLSNVIEGWIAEHGSKIENWFHAIAFFDAYNSLGNLAFNHPDYVYPEIVKVATVLKASNAAHPMLDPKKRVANDFEIGVAEFIIITGANMAGKSTFLRTISLQIVMANIGLPVCASSASYNPIKLITSMRTSDSLTNDESYFFSELKRLKFIVDQIEDDRYFIVLDEILKGTNSTDKAIGSRKFVERLVQSKATGLIATHDLSLCNAADELTRIRNYYFDAEILNSELHFDYKFKEGVCENMNASFLLEKMGIVKKEK